MVARFLRLFYPNTLIFRNSLEARLGTCLQRNAAMSHQTMIVRFVRLHIGGMTYFPLRADQERKRVEHRRIEFLHPRVHVSQGVVRRREHEVEESAVVDENDPPVDLLAG